MAQGIYLDNSMTTRPSTKAVATMLPFFTELWGTPSAPHQMGQELYPAITQSLKAIYTMIGAKEGDDFVFTSSGAEAVNHVITSAWHDVTRNTGKNHFVTSAIDEAPAIMAIGRLEQMECLGKMVAPGKHGRIEAQAIAEAISPRTAMVSLSWANALTGVINPVAEISEICKERGILFHLDATHVLGKLFYQLEDVGADFITFNGDNLHAPKGTGGIHIRDGIRCSPFIVGGIEQAGHRAGSYSIGGLAALGVAAAETSECRDMMCTEVARLRDKLETGVMEGYPDAIACFRDQERIPNSTAIAFPGVSNEALLYALNKRGVYACIGGGTFQQIGLILAACGIEEAVAQSAINFTLSRETTEDEIDRAIAIVVDAAHKLRKGSLWV